MGNDSNFFKNNGFVLIKAKLLKFLSYLAELLTKFL